MLRIGLRFLKNGLKNIKNQLIVITLKVFLKKRIVREEKKENNMRKYSNEIIDKIELIKEIIVSRSILRNIRDDIKWELEIESDRINGKIYEITLYLKVIDQDCSDCHFEPDGILEEIHKYQKSIYNSISKITFDQNLNMVKGSGSLRGIRVSEVNFALDTITIEYGIFIDIEKEYDW
jgi:hypothetical protein